MLCIVKNGPPMKSGSYASLEFWAEDRRNSAAMLRVLFFLISLGAGVIRAMCRRRADLVLENLVLRQQVTALKKERPRPLLEDLDRAFWVAPRRSWPVWASRLVMSTRTRSRGGIGIDSEDTGRRSPVAPSGAAPR